MVGVSVSVPVPEPQQMVFDGGFMPVLAIGEQDGELFLLEQPTQMFFVQSSAPQEKETDAKDEADCKDCEQKNLPMERSFFFKNWFNRPAAPVSAVTLVQPAPPPPVVRVPSPVVVGTVYQPVSLVTGLTPPIATGGIFTGTGLPSPFTGLVGQQGILSGSRPIIQVARPQPPFGFLPNGMGSSFGSNLQHVMRPIGEIHTGASAQAGSSSFSSASASVVSSSSNSNPAVQQHGNGGLGGTGSLIGGHATQLPVPVSQHGNGGSGGTGSLIGGHAPQLPVPVSQQASIDKVIDIMGQLSKS